MKEDFLNERIRAEDILLGSLGFGEDAHIVSLQPKQPGYAGTGQFPDGEIFEFSYDDELDDQQRWALEILSNGKRA